jgi:hypothetical protein
MWTSDSDSVIEVIAIIGIFFVPFIVMVFIIWFQINERMKRYKLQAHLYEKAIEKGMALPKDLFTSRLRLARRSLRPSPGTVSSGRAEPSPGGAYK